MNEMTWRERGAWWIRTRSKTLKAAATKAEKAYSSGTAAEACALVAKAYREAAAVLDHHAKEMASQAKKQ